MSDGYPNLKDLGVKLHTVQEKMVWELEFHRAFRWHEYRSNEEKPQINPLVPLNHIEVKEITADAEDRKNLMLNFSGLVGKYFVWEGIWAITFVMLIFGPFLMV